ncbi:uncharacterized protein LOC142802870 isoform X2 [Rhipicephalus microplus]|uniref:uncharacterized protein LOC142802870 isoform X2 n=1 Tax=Rhipicephalus microplus TaxID=6941 RepID=UPI003F6C020D
MWFRGSKRHLFTVSCLLCASEVYFQAFVRVPPTVHTRIEIAAHYCGDCTPRPPDVLFPNELCIEDGAAPDRKRILSYGPFLLPSELCCFLLFVLNRYT